MTYQGIVKSGAIVLDHGVELPEGQVVSVRIEMPIRASDQVTEDLWRHITATW